MIAAAEATAHREVQRKLAEWLGNATAGGPTHGGDFSVETTAARFVVVFKASSQTSSVASAIGQMKQWKLRKHDLPLLVVPFMGPAGSRLCAEAAVSWLDLSGNAEIRSKGLIVHSEGRPNQFKRVGRPESIFSPAASRVTRWLLAHTNERLSQRDIATETGLDAGFVSRIVRRLVEQNLVTRTNRNISVRDPALLLRAWAEAYEFSRHTVVRAHAEARSSEALCASLSKGLSSLGHKNAATGLSAAWLMTRFTGFRLVTIFVEQPVDERSFRQLDLRHVERGENVWLVIPNDAGVFIPTVSIDGIPCVHPVQVYVDLQAHPERAAEATGSVRDYFLRGTHGDQT